MTTNPIVQDHSWHVHLSNHRFLTCEVKAVRNKPRKGTNKPQPLTGFWTSPYRLKEDPYELARLQMHQAIKDLDQTDLCEWGRFSASEMDQRYRYAWLLFCEQPQRAWSVTDATTATSLACWYPRTYTQVTPLEDMKPEGLDMAALAYHMDSLSVSAEVAADRNGVFQGWDVESTLWFTWQFTNVIFLELH